MLNTVLDCICQYGRVVGWTTGIRQGQGFFPFHRRVQIGSGAQPASYPMGTGDPFPNLKRQGRQADCSLPRSTPYVFTKLCLIK